MLNHGQIWYGDKFAVIQRDEDATATVSEMTFNADGSISLGNAQRMVSLFDAMNVAAIDGDAQFREHIDNPSTVAAQGLIPLDNGATVLLADIACRINGDAEGYVLASWGTDRYVTWHVAKGPRDSRYSAYWGHYFESYESANADYDSRREN